MTETSNEKGFGWKLAQLRMEEGYTSDQYATITGLSANNIRRLEQGRDTRVNLLILPELARFHGITVQELLDPDVPIPDRTTRALERLRLLDELYHLEWVDLTAELRTLRKKGISEEQLRDWGTHRRRELYRRQGKLVI